MPFLSIGSFDSPDKMVIYRPYFTFICRYLKKFIYVRETSKANKAVLKPLVSLTFAILYFCNHSNI